MKFLAKTEDKKLIFSDKKYLLNFLSELPNGQHLIVDIRKRRSIRSDSQNAFYWGYILNEIAFETGHTTEELHEAFKTMFLPRKFVEIREREVQITQSTTSLSTLEFAEYVDKIMVFGSQNLGIIWVDVKR